LALHLFTYPCTRFSVSLKSWVTDTLVRSVVVDTLCVGVAIVSVGQAFIFICRKMQNVQ